MVAITRVCVRVASAVVPLAEPSLFSRAIARSSALIVSEIKLYFYTVLWIRLQHLTKVCAINDMDINRIKELLGRKKRLECWIIFRK